MPCCAGQAVEDAPGRLHQAPGPGPGCARRLGAPPPVEEGALLASRQCGHNASSARPARVEGAPPP
eukprot:8584201-Lingulodinium_polyedra.AAC.1